MFLISLFLAIENVCKPVRRWDTGGSFDREDERKTTKMKIVCEQKT